VSSTDWLVVLTAAALIAFELWFFLARPSGGRGTR
jgi:hypothetical protein